MQVVTEKLEFPPLSLQNTEGIRLMTVDIGTTTIAMQLYDADGKIVDSFPSVNPQVSYGADVLSRIEAARDPGKAADMQKKVLDLIKKGVQRFSKKLQEKESIQMVIAANTTMTYLLMCWDPAELGTFSGKSLRSHRHTDRRRPLSYYSRIVCLCRRGHHSGNTGLSNAGAGGTYAAHRSGYQR